MVYALFIIFYKQYSVCYDYGWQFVFIQLKAGKALLDNPAKGHGIWQFILKRIVIVIAVGLACLLAYHTGMRVTGCTVMADEAMTARINYAFELSGIDQSALKRFFTPAYIQSGELDKQKQRYAPYKIKGYNESTTTDYKWSWPGSDVAHVDVTERISAISGEARNRDELPDVTIPEWGDGVYRLTLKRIDDKWLIDNIEYLEPAPTPRPLPTDDTTGTPAGSGTAETPDVSPTMTPTISPDATGTGGE